MRVRSKLGEVGRSRQGACHARSRRVALRHIASCFETGACERSWKCAGALVYTSDIVVNMDTLSESVSTRALRDELADVVGRVSYGHERIGVTRNGKLAAVVIGVEDLELLEQLENARDLAEYRAAKAADEGRRVALDELLAEFVK